MPRKVQNDKGRHAGCLRHRECNCINLFSLGNKVYRNESTFVFVLFCFSGAQHVQPGIAEGRRRAATAAAASRDRSLCGCSSAILAPQGTTKNSSQQKPGTSHLFLSCRKSSGPNPALNFSLNWKHMVSIMVGDALCLGSSHQGFKWVFSCRIISSFLFSFPE